MVRDKNTMIFGGFNVKRLSNSERKIPLLGDIPWLGALFTYNSAGGSNRERLFLLTPRKVEIDKSPLDYATDLNSRYINKALDTVAQKFPTERLEPTSEELLDDVQRAVKTLTLEAVPAGFRRVPLSKYIRQNPTYRNKKWCSGLGSFIDYDSASVYVGEDFNVLVAHTVNFKTTDVIYDRSFCRKKAVIGSGLWPRNKLAPGESGEIFIVIKKTTGKTKR
ncbi:hypothetical protein [Veronia nyctiphanis]|nr:hypothetical protein [Veronia nyctiphanis]